MHIINAMFAKSLGGIEQCAVDYAEALAGEGHEVTCLVRKNAAIIPEIKKLNGINIIETSNLSQWNPFQKQKLKKQLSDLGADIVIAHGNRALKLLAQSNCPVVGVTHNYSLDHMPKADAVIALTDDLANHAIKAGVEAEKIIRLPNMIRIPSSSGKISTAMHTPPQISAMGRFVKKKGFNVFLKALALLKQRNISFHASLAGDGEEADNLKKLARTLKLDAEQVTFTGWIGNKQQLFDKSDIFCIPSFHEPFGIIVLEALAHTLPTVATSSEGPTEILTDDENALLVPVGNAELLADALEKLITTPELALKIAKNGRELISKHYEITVVAKKLSTALKALIENPTITAKNKPK